MSELPEGKAGHVYVRLTHSVLCLTLTHLSTEAFTSLLPSGSLA